MTPLTSYCLSVFLFARGFFWCVCVPLEFFCEKNKHTQILIFSKKKIYKLRNKNSSEIR